MIDSIRCLKPGNLIKHMDSSPYVVLSLKPRKNPFIVDIQLLHEGLIFWAVFSELDSRYISIL